MLQIMTHSIQKKLVTSSKKKLQVIALVFWLNFLTNERQRWWQTGSLVVVSRQLPHDLIALLLCAMAQSLHPSHL